MRRVKKKRKKCETSKVNKKSERKRGRVRKRGKCE